MKNPILFVNKRAAERVVNKVLIKEKIVNRAEIIFARQRCGKTIDSGYIIKFYFVKDNMHFYLRDTKDWPYLEKLVD